MRAALLTPVLLFSFFVPFLAVTPVAAEPIVDLSICTDALRNGDELPTICDPAVDQTASDNILVGSQGMITRLTKVLVWISGILAVILMIISGLMFIFSSGNAESAGRARRTALYAVIGMVVAVIGQLIVSYVLDKL